MLADKRNIRLRNRKVGVDWIETLHDDERRTARADEIARVDVANASASIDRRTNRAVVEIHLRGGDCGISFHRIRLRSVVILPGDDLLRPQVGSALQSRMRERGISLRG